MLWLLLATALAQDAQEFRPVPGSEIVEGERLEGILIDEATYKELGKLRVDVKEQANELEAFEEWKETQDKVFVDSLTKTQKTCQEGMVELQQHYDKALQRAQKKDALQRHAMPIGIAVGVVVSTAVYAGATRFYGEVLQPSQ
jgi:chaperonin cofactor prefoldin